MASKKKTDDLELETVDIPIPTGDSEKHLHEIKLLFTAPAGVSVDDVHGCVIAWILRGARGYAEVAVQYGASIKNKTLMNAKDRSAFLKKYEGRMLCTGYDNKPLPKGATTITVLRVKKKEKARGKRG